MLAHGDVGARVRIVAARLLGTLDRLYARKALVQIYRRLSGSQVKSGCINIS